MARPSSLPRPAAPAHDSHSRTDADTTEETPLLAQSPNSTITIEDNDDAKLAALFAVPWYRRAPLVQVLIFTILPLIALIASIPTQSQAVLNWACDYELSLRGQHNALPIVPLQDGLRSDCFPSSAAALATDNDGLGLAVQQRASTVLATSTLLLSITTMFTTSVWGKLTDTFGRLPSLRAGMLSFAALTSCSLSYVVLPVTWNPWTTYVLSVTSGLLGGMSTFDIAISAYVTDLTKDDERAAMFGLVQGLIAGAAMVAPVLGAWIVWMSYGSPVPLLVGALATVGLSIAAFAFAWEPKRTMPKLTRADVVAMVLNPFASLAVFRPKWAPGAMYRLYLLAVSMCGAIMVGLIENVWTLYTAFNFGWGQLDWSVMMTVLSGMSAGLLVVGYPLVARVFRKYTVVPKLPGVGSDDVQEDEEELTIAVDDAGSSSTTRVKAGTVDSEMVVEQASSANYDDADVCEDPTSVCDPLISSSASSTSTSTAADQSKQPPSSADPLSVYDHYISATRLDTPAIAFSCLLSLLGMLIQSFAHTGPLFFSGSLLRSFSAIVQPIRSAMLTRLVPATHTGQMFSAMSLVMAGVSVPTPVIANWIYRRSLEARAAGGIVLPGADVFLVAAGVAGVGFVLSVGAAVGVEVVRRRQEHEVQGDRREVE
ncbi:major facilitator superfamily domain-containing protein [Catenaria anguillulae PL171]|uniref:Major facilitator superfamily domain-containing protein n=1 Tax=Catenaria anguillulae PL171 TaxID=765915 RepID=A0A1Y2I300_9FUNG|nr:major facilitator superfamily domain-containing protein [Catenaria anguillulae PL171]